MNILKKTLFTFLFLAIAIPGSIIALYYFLKWESFKTAEQLTLEWNHSKTCYFTTQVPTLKGYPPSLTRLYNFTSDDISIRAFNKQDALLYSTETILHKLVWDGEPIRWSGNRIIFYGSTNGLSQIELPGCI